MTIKHLYPNARPSLDLKFAKDKVLDPRITYSRASSGTYFDATGTLQSAATNEARFDHDPITGESLGLLVEEQRTNLVLRSEYFSDSYWLEYASGTGVAPTVIPEQAVAPDGTITADQINFSRSTSTNSDASYIQSGNLGPTAVAYAGSVWVKAATAGDVGKRIQFRHVSSSGTPLIHTLTLDWQRISTVETGVAGTRRLEFGLITSAISDTSVSVHAWGAQVELGSFPTSYIPTTPTFTSRSTIATYYDANGVIQTAGIDVARDNAYFPDENGVMRPAGLLLEAAGTNLVTYSEQFDNAAWSKNQLTVTANATNSPDGTATADKLVEDTTNNYHQIASTNVTLANPSFSCYVKAAGRNFVNLKLFYAGGGNRVWATFNLVDGSITDQGKINTFFTNESAKSESLGNSWFRLTLSASTASAQSILGTIEISDAAVPTRINGSPVYTGDGTSGIYIWGAQLEASPYPTSYIPTSGSTVTRAADVSSSSTVTRSADVAQITGSNFSSWWNQAEGTAFVNYKTSSREQFNSPFSFRISAASNAQSWGHWTYNGGSQSRVPIYGQRPSPNEPQYLIGTFNSIDLNRYYKVAISQDGSNMSGCIETDTTRTRSMTALPAMSVLTIGWVGSTSQRMTGHIARLTYYPVRLPDATLQNLTS